MARPRTPAGNPFAVLDAELRAFALDLPAAWTDIPWESDLVAKVGKKIFAFLGPDDSNGVSSQLGVKLTEEHEHALTYPWASPSRHGLGRHGWVSCFFDAANPPPPTDLLCEWIEESYRNVALKRYVKELDARR